MDRTKPGTGPASKRIIGLGIWPVAFLLIFFDITALRLYDFAFLFILTSLGTWTVLTRLRWLRCVITVGFLLVILFAMDYEPIFRSVASKTSNQGSVETAVALLQALKPFRAYGTVAAVCLFGIALSGKETDKCGKQ